MRIVSGSEYCPGRRLSLCAGALYGWLSVDVVACVCVQLTDEERVYLNAAALGDVPIIRQSLEETNEISLNVNCVDYMGRSALHLAVDSESMEAVELLLDRINFECIEESLLHAISKGATKIVKVRPPAAAAADVSHSEPQFDQSRRSSDLRVPG